MFVACGHISQRQSKRLFKMFLWWKLQTFCWCAGGCEISLHVCWSSLSCLRWKLLDVQRKVQFLWFSLKCLTCSDNRTTWYNYSLFLQHVTDCCTTTARSNNNLCLYGNRCELRVSALRCSSQELEGFSFNWFWCALRHSPSAAANSRPADGTNLLFASRQ